MYLPKLIAGTVLSGATLASMFFPSNSFAHRLVSQYIFPTLPQHPAIASKKIGTASTRVFIETKVYLLTPTPSVKQNSVIPTESIKQNTSVITVSQTPTVTVTPTPTSAPLAPTSAPTTSSQLATDVQSYIMNAINDYRHAKGLSSVQTNAYTCRFAATRAQEITTNFSHDGFTSRVNSKTLPYPSYSFVTENLAEASNYKDVVNMWIASAGHEANLRADTPYVCVAQSGDYYAMEGWKP